MSNTIIKLDEVKRRTTFSGSTIYRLAAEDKFPKPIKLSERSSGWLLREVHEYLEKRIQNR
ncbi:hypothetical protein SP60_07705 [Candidatus Thioglobus autotrophicus]|jgi:prophage regulatory protein|uniref:AlpA family transcriptional regulator n=1 Tax=Candidatus Thioglobus autotrophicus TaxID=1705394 RepID=A0A0M3TUK5_9GAMM|nr:AlpA family phage regulatory protein [Candidatus Thioglobus autotrophicus]ALE53085.1 hypothetical protein SP60_07705 [Candidatus Thioglobus autotrophicus]